MRVAPSVQAASSGAGLWRWLQQALYGISAAVLAHWIGRLAVDEGAGLALASLALGLLIAILAGRFLAAAAPRQLLWDGRSWAVTGADGTRQEGRVTLMLDLGRWMLVRLLPMGPRRSGTAFWLPLRERDGAAHWPALRVALHAPPAADDAPHAAA